jgi:hypothetical protein
MKNILQLIVLTLVLAAGVFAQLEQAEPMVFLNLNGSETSPGKFNEPMGQTTDNSFILDGTSGEYSSTLLTISFNYGGAADHENGNAIVGGTWSLALYTVEGGYRGSIFGDVQHGQITWAVGQESTKPFGSAGSRNTAAWLVVTGTTGDFDPRPIAGNEVYFEATTDTSDAATIAVLKGLRF